jgi:hypothetical protein
LTAGPIALRARPELQPTLDRLRSRVLAHPFFVIAMVLAIVPRVFAMLGYQTAVLFRLDTFDYLWGAVHVSPNPINPSGYSLFLWLLRPAHSLVLIAGLQHLMGLGVAVMVYVILQRHGVADWLATVATLPVLFDPGQLMLEQLIMSDMLGMFLLMASLTVLLVRRMPSVPRAAIAGALMALSALVRPTVLPLIILIPLFLLARRGWRQAAAALLAGIVPLVAYGLWFNAVWGTFGLTNSDGLFLWSRTMTFAQCSVINPPPSLQPLCPSAQPGRLGTAPLSKRPTPTYYLWNHDAWMWRDSRPAFAPDEGAFTAHNNQLGRDFGIRAIEAQPLGYFSSVWHGVLTALSGHYPLRFPKRQPNLQLRGSDYTYALGAVKAYTGSTQGVGPYLGWRYGTRMVAPFSYLVGLYQRIIYLPGPVFVAILVVGLAGLLIPKRRSSVAVLLWLSAVVLIVVPVAEHEFDPRYLIPAVPLGCMAAALAFRDRRKDLDTQADSKDTQADPAPEAQGGTQGPPSEGVQGAGLETSP